MNEETHIDGLDTNEQASREQVTDEALVPGDVTLAPGETVGQPGDGEIQPMRQKPRLLWIALSLLGLVLLGGAAFLGARLLNQQPGSGLQGMAFVPSGKGGVASQAGKSVQLNMEPAPEIPQNKAEVNGVITEIKDRSLFVGMGKDLVVSINDDGSTGIHSDQDIPTLEVVVTGDTKLYRDATFDNQKVSESETIQQIVEPIEFSALGNNSFVSVWGQKRGDRLIAEVVLYMQVQAGGTGGNKIAH